MMFLTTRGDTERTNHLISSAQPIIYITHHTMMEILDICHLLQHSSTAYLGTVGLDCVVNVDEDEEDGHQQSHPPGNYFRINQETRESRNNCQFVST